MTTETHNASVPCVACGYDLRGLPPRGNCPECGLEVATSLAALVVPVPPVDPAWRRHIVESAALSLAAFLLLFAASFIPAGPTPNFQWVTSVTPLGFQAVAVLAVLAWAAQWYASIKLGFSPRPDRPGRVARGLVWALWILATLYTALPAAALLSTITMRPGRGGMIRPVGLFGTALTWAAPLAAAAFYARLALVFRRLRTPVLAGQAAMLAVLMPLALSEQSFTGPSAWGPVGLYVILPSYQHGHPSMLAYFLRMLPSASLLDSRWALAAAAVPLCGTYLLAMLLVVALRTRPARPGGAGRHSAG